MSSIVVRFPDGSKEFRYPERMLEAGDVVFHDGSRFIVTGVSTDGGGQFIAVVEPESPSVGDLLQSEEGAIRLALIDS
jgi:hypothetical protein